MAKFVVSYLSFLIHDCAENYNAHVYFSSLVEKLCKFRVRSVLLKMFFQWLYSSILWRSPPCCKCMAPSKNMCEIPVDVVSVYSLIVV